ncbi:GDSL esterase/lipase At1g06990-like [Populus nigra]|uniref:GDSL esterase/lipase At1g06990-like n=1 Tax=Populus nigra TaxID=3691 RepID=UPI002B269AAC|nr:GDSL esterase/lipase At1g06990-like [Populus nigra]
MASMKPSVVLVYILTIFFKTGNATRSRSFSKFPAILVFGDSTVDSGNNNEIDTLFKANFRPYGRRYPGHTPTGRFSDGRLITDFLASILKIKNAVPPFLKPDLSDHEIATGVSFASSGSGYDNATNDVFGVISFPKQIDMFRDYTARLRRIVGEQKAKNIIGAALVVISTGTNDISTLRMDKNDTGYQDFLLNKVQFFTKQLYDLGCRSMIVAGLPPIGCLPIQMTTKQQPPSRRRCLHNQNLYCVSYNQKLASMLPLVQAKLSGSKIAYADIYEPLMDMIHHPQKYGFEETNKGCCGTGFVEMGPLCNPTTPTCRHPSRYLFWDAVHPGQSTYQYLTKYVEKKVLPKFL